MLLCGSSGVFNDAVKIHCCVLCCYGGFSAKYRYWHHVEASRLFVSITFALFLLSFFPSFNFIQFLTACCAACMIGRGNSGASRRY